MQAANPLCFDLMKSHLHRRWEEAEEAGMRSQIGRYKFTVAWPAYLCAASTAIPFLSAEQHLLLFAGMQHVLEDISDGLAFRRLATNAAGWF